MALKITLQRASRRPGIPTDRLLRRWLRAALPDGAEVTVRIVNAAEGQRLNRAYRGRDYATNVLTFVYHQTGETPCGDLVLCAPVISREAREQGKRLEHHYAHLLVHGALHLLGWDHLKAKEARLMEREEIRILASLGVDDPYSP